jgi:hypothetical protein
MGGLSGRRVGAVVARHQFPGFLHPRLGPALDLGHAGPGVERERDASSLFAGGLGPSKVGDMPMPLAPVCAQHLAVEEILGHVLGDVLGRLPGRETLNLPTTGRDPRRLREHRRLLPSRVIVPA